MGITLKCEKREIFGKNAARRLRREGKIPAVLYGEGNLNVSLSLEKKDIFSILKSEAGENTIFKVSFDSEKRDAMIKEFQKDVVTDEALHVDLLLIAMDKRIRVSVPVVLTGDAVGVKAEGGFVDFISRELEIECFPKDIPENIEVDISDLHLHQSIKVEELPPPEGGVILNDLDSVIALIQSPAKEVEEVVEEEEEEVLPEGEEPEVIKKDKDEEEGKE